MAEENDYRVLSIQSHVVSGYCGNKSAVFPLQTLGFEVDFINSVQFSNHTGYGKWCGHVLESKELLDLLDGLATNGLDQKFTHLLTGYARSESFLNALGDVIRKVKSINPNVMYVCDPVLGDNGALYVPKELVSIYRDKIIQLADVLKPNQFEAEILSGIKIVDTSTAIQAIDKFHSMGIKTVVLSSMDIPKEDGSGGRQLLSMVSSIVQPTGAGKVNGNSNGNNGEVNGSDVNGAVKQRQLYSISITRKEGVFIGTGDIFAALFLAWFTKTGFDAKETLEKVIATIQAIIQRTSAIAEKLPGGVKKTANIELKIVQSRHDILVPPVVINASPVKF